jgi:hypothetical protein
VPQNELPEPVQPFTARDDRGEVVARQLSRLAREARVAVWEEQLRLADAAGIEQQLAGGGIARRVLRPDADVEVAHRNPGGPATPAGLDELALERQQTPEGGDCLRRGVFLEPCREAKVA